MKRDGQWKQLNVSTHNGTHMDAPYHYHSTMDNGERAIQLMKCLLNGVMEMVSNLIFVHFLMDMLLLLMTLNVN